MKSRISRKMESALAVTGAGKTARSGPYTGIAASASPGALFE